MTETPPILVLTDADHTYYLLPADPFTNTTWGSRATWTSADSTLRVHRGKDNAPARWWRADGRPQTLTATRPGPSVRTGFKLRNPAAASEAFPLERTSLGGLDDDTATALYVAVYENGPTETLTFEPDGMTLLDAHGAPPPDDGLHWVANLPDAIKQRVEIHHLFPGHLHGFPAAVEEALEQQPHQRVPGFVSCGVHIDRQYPTRIEVYTSVAYEPHHTRQVHDIGRNGQKLRRTRTVTESKRLQVVFNVPAVIAGTNRAEAVQRWEASIADAVAMVAEALTPAPCWHCQGTGVVSAKAAAAAGAA